MGARGRPCRICADARLLQQVTSLIELGSSQVKIAAAVGINKFAVGRHARHAFHPSAPSGAPDEPGNELQMSDERLNRWLLRTEEMYQASHVQADLRGAVESLRAGVRAKLELRRRLEKKAEQAPADDLPLDQRPVTVAYLDDCIRRTREADKARGFVPCPLCSLGSLSPKTIAERLPLLKVENNEHSENPN